MASKIYSVILAGGSGSRFWPLSRQSSPKQFLSISENGESLIQATARRVEPLVGNGHCVVVTNVLHEKQVREHVPEAHVICEPILRNTAASIGLAALHVARQNPEGILIVLPADHAVSKEQNLRDTLQRAVDLASSGERLVTVGIKPTAPNTGYGYIKAGGQVAGQQGFEIAEFCEKPDLERAREYVASGKYFWNSGMFVWQASVYLEAVRQFLPELFQALQNIDQALGSGEELSVIKKNFEGLKSISVDYGIMEKAANCFMVEAIPYGWNDVGAWDAWAEHFEKDSSGNIARGDVITLASANCIVHSSGRTLALLGVEDLIVIETPDAVLVCDRKRAQEVKSIVQVLEDTGRKELL